LTTKTVALLFCPTLDSTLLSHREHTFGHRNFLLTQGELMLQQCQRFLSDAQFFFQGLGGLGSDDFLQGGADLLHLALRFTYTWSEGYFLGFQRLAERLGFLPHASQLRSRLLLLSGLSRLAFPLWLCRYRLGHLLSPCRTLGLVEDHKAPPRHQSRQANTGYH
jgi:hypothetical protein